MALNLSVWEDSGAIISGHGTTRDEVDNLGFKDSSLPESTTFADYPIRRPIDDELFTTSFRKYYYFKFGGTFTDVQNIAIQFLNDAEGVAGSTIAGNLRILYKWTNIYAEPTTELLDGMTYDPSNPPVWSPKISPVGPEAATSYLDPSANTTYYTQYLVTQLYLDKDISEEQHDYGNLEEAFKLKMIFL